MSAADRDLLVSAAWLRDIGYAPESRQTGFHPLDGAHHLEALGAPLRLVQLVAHHSGAVYEAEQRGLSAELAEYEREDSKALDALVLADVTDMGPLKAAYGCAPLWIRKDPDRSVSAADGVFGHLEKVPPAGFEPAHTAPERMR